MKDSKEKQRDLEAIERNWRRAEQAEARVRELTDSNEKLRQCVVRREQEVLDAAAEADELRAKVRELEAERDRLRESGDALFLSTIGFSPDVQMASARVGWKNARCRAASASATGSAKVATECIHLRAYRNERTQDDWCPDCGAIRYAETIRDEGSSDGWLKPTAVTLVADADSLRQAVREAYFTTLEPHPQDAGAWMYVRRVHVERIRAALASPQPAASETVAASVERIRNTVYCKADPGCMLADGHAGPHCGTVSAPPPEAVAGQAAVEPVTYADLQVIARAIDAPSNRTRFGGAASIADRARDALRKVHAVLLEAQPAAEQGHLSTVAAVAESLPVSEEDERTVDAMVARVQGETRPIEREADERAGAEQDDEP